MKKLALILMATSAALFGFGVAEAQYGGVNAVVTAAPPVVTPGGQFRTTFTGCTPGESVTFVLVSSNATAACTGPATLGGSLVGLLLPAQAEGTGTATAELTAPQAPGEYTGTGTTSQSNLSEPFTITVLGATSPSGGLPATGSGGISTATGIALGLLIMGIGLFAVAQIRRRRTAVA